MTEKIEELFNDNKFDLILFYLKENGIDSTEDLSSVNFSELTFVPGVSNELINEAYSLYMNKIEGNTASNKEILLSDNISKGSRVSNFGSCQNEAAVIGDDLRTNTAKEKKYEFESAKYPQITNIMHDAEIADVYLGVPRSNRFVKNCLLNNKTLMSQLSLEDFESATNIRGLDQHSAEALREAYIEYLSPDKASIFHKRLKLIGDRGSDCLIKRLQGFTLEKIAKDHNVTRERVRQIVNRACNELRCSAEMLALSIFTQDKNWFSASDLYQVFSDSINADCCKYVLIQSSKVVYLDFSDKFIRSDMCPNNLNIVLRQFAKEMIGNGININDILDNIEAELSAKRLGFLNIEDIMNYLVKNGYHFYGDYVSKGSPTYPSVCYDAILKYFSFDLKLDSNDDNEDIEKLRGTINRRYTGLALPDSNRALTAGLARVLILSGRGRYCPFEKIVYDADLLNEIFDHIQSSPQTSFYYTEIFSMFQGRLLTQTNITNSNMLHGVLQYFYPDDFQFERDLLVKRGSERSDINQRLCSFITQTGRPVTKEEIKEVIPGIKDYMFGFVVERTPELMQWEYNTFNHWDNISFDQDDYNLFQKILSKETVQNNGYLSEEILFRRVREVCPNFFEKNQIESSMNLFYIAAYVFRLSYRFRRPHIITNDFPVEELSGVNIAKVLLNCDSELSYEAFVSLANSFGWSSGTQSSLFKTIESDFIRISQDRYILKSKFNLDLSSINATKNQINHLVNASGYFTFDAICSFDSFPEGKYEWNVFLLESIINEYILEYKIIYPQVTDRRHPRGIIVSSDSPINSFVEFVASLLRQDGIATLSEIEMINYLKNRGIINNHMPQELYNCSRLTYKNEVFSLILANGKVKTIV
jgi:hypothetical protein